jgi:hypothetical protein
VLPNPNPKTNLDTGIEEVSNTHGAEKLEDAIERFHDRQDRKRSDEYLISLLPHVLGPGMAVPEQYLYI